ALPISNRIVAEISATEHWPAIEELVQVLVDSGELSEDASSEVLSGIKAREEQSSTGIGNGVAIPHCYSEQVDEGLAIFGRSKEGLDFCSIDRAPVHFVIMLINPKGATAKHLKTLSSIAKTMNSAETRERLAAAADATEILAILSEH
ncbi:MAG: PTS sugar transporter subunit IIA, partial [Verrucomicrobiota bacterium]